MYLNARVAVVIPCFRVESYIKCVISAIPNFVDEIIAVNDASDDSTRTILEGMREPRLTVIHHRKNQGIGGAMITGFKEALKREADVVVKVDGDGQMDTRKMVSLINPILTRKCDYAKGNRLSSPDDMKGMPSLRLFGNLALSFLTKFASGYWKIMDPQNGYIAISRKVLSRIDLSKIAKNYFFENSMLIEISLQNARIADVVMPSKYGGEKSWLGIQKILLEFPFQLIKGFLRRLIIKNVLRDLSPFAIFLSLGLLLFTPGAALGLWLWLKALFTPNLPAAPTGTIMLSLVPLICGYILIVLSIVIDIIFSPEILLLEFDEDAIAEMLKSSESQKS